MSPTLGNVGSELRVLLRLALPGALNAYLTRVSDYWTLAFVGHLDPSKSHYDAVVMSTIHTNITFTAIVSGICGGLGTFCAQAKGAGVAHKNGVHFRRCGVIMLGVLCFSFLAALFAEQILVAVGQPSVVARDTAIYARVTMLSMPFETLSTMLNAAIASQGMPEVGLYGTMASAPVQVLLAWGFVSIFGYLGLGMAKIAKSILRLAVIVLFAHRRGLQPVVWRLRQEDEASVNCPGILVFLRVAVPSLGITWFEWASFELLSFIVGRTPNATVNIGAFGTLFTNTAVFYMTFTAIAGAVSTRVGHLVGARQTRGARLAVAVALTFTTALGVVVSLAMYIFRWELCRMFTSDPDIVQAAVRGMLGVSLTIPSYAVMMASYGASRGSGRQRVAAASTIVGYWVVGLPLAYALGPAGGMPENPVLGVWLGNASAVSFSGLATLLALCCGTDWATLRPVRGVEQEESSRELADRLQHAHEELER